LEELNRYKNEGEQFNWFYLEDQERSCHPFANDPGSRGGTNTGKRGEYIMRKIQSVTVVTSTRTNPYFVGGEVNSILIAEIKNVSLEFEDHIYIGYEGYCQNGELLFVVENCPVVVEWMEGKVNA
jgi:hypothetical protein